MNKKLGIIGGGAIAESQHIPAALRLVSPQEIVVVEANHQRREYLNLTFPEIEFHASVDSCVDLGLCLIATPPHTHKSLCEWCLERQIPVLCEKPLANQFSECAELVKLQQRSETPCFVAHNYRLFPSRVALRKKIQHASMPVHMCIDEGAKAGWPTKTGYTFRKEMVPGGVVLNNGIHSLDFAIWCLGAPADIGYKDDSLGGLESNAFLGLTFGDGSTLEHTISRTCLRSNRISVMIGEEKIILPVFERGGEPMYSEIDIAELQLREFQKVLKGDKPELCTFAEGAEVMRIISSCYDKKAERDRPKTLPVPGTLW